ncbi:hypothetical protein Tco_0949898 [Tanacetum coccineum]
MWMISSLGQQRSLCVKSLRQLMKSRFQMSSMERHTFFHGPTRQQKPDGIFISQDKYVAEILKKFDFASVKTASTPIETQKPLADIMLQSVHVLGFNHRPKTSHLSAVKRIFRYLKGKPKLGLWYPRESSFDLESYSDSDYAGANLDRKSTTGGCQFLGRRLITWQCKKQTIVATSTTEAEYVAAASCCGQNPVYHSKTKHIAIRHHFIRDAYEKKLIQPILVLGCLNWDDKFHNYMVKGEAMHERSYVDKRALISLTDDLSLRSNMAALESCPKHNMIAYLEKTEGNVEFHEVIDFLQRSYISHALTVSPVVSTTFVEQFWTSAKSKTINNVRHITAKVAGKLVSISEASIRTDLLFDDADGTDTLPNQAIFDAIQLMGYEGDLTEKGASSERLSEAQPSPSPEPTSEAPNESLPDSSSQPGEHTGENLEIIHQ